LSARSLPVARFYSPGGEYEPKPDLRQSLLGRSAPPCFLRLLRETRVRAVINVFLDRPPRSPTTYFVITHDTFILGFVRQERYEHDCQPSQNRPIRRTRHHLPRVLRSHVNIVINNDCPDGMINEINKLALAYYNFLLRPMYAKRKFIQQTPHYACTGWSRSARGALLVRYVVKNDESYQGSMLLGLLSV
jgi:hypothetical protein